MSARRLLPFCAGLLLVFAAAAHAIPLVDPFLERLRVGSYQDAAKLPLRDGWPVDLFLPCRVDSLWRASEEAVLQEVAGSGTALSCRDLLDAALGGPEPRRVWATRERARLVDALFAPAAPDSTAGAPRWLAEESLELSALRNYSLGNYGTAAVQADRLLTGPLRGDLPPEVRFVWGLRARRLRELSTHAPRPAEIAPWPELLDLGSYDADSGWAIWCARQRALARPLLPPGCGTDALARWLARAGSTDLGGAELDAAGFAPEAFAAVGAACLPRGPLLDQHFARHPQPPADPRFQEIWLRGRLRAGGWEPALAESWAAQPGVLPSGRARLWRRAAEERLLKGEWPAALADLGQAFAAARADETLRAQVAAQAQQAELLFAVRRLDAEQARARELARAALPPPEWTEWVEGLAPALAHLGRGAPPDTAFRGGWEASARRRVRAGLSATLAPPAGAPPAPAWPATTLLWDIWLAWGRNLGAALGGGLADARATEYRDALAAAAGATTPAARETLARAAIGRFLLGHPLADPALRWLLERERQRLAGTDASPAGPPLPPGAQSARDWPDRHALLGLAIAAGDAHAQLSLARELPATGVPERDRLLLIYPVPGPGPLRAELGRAGVDPALLLALVRNESLFDPGARSHAGALGWLQIMPLHYPGRGAPRGEPLWRRPVASLRTGSRLLLENARAFAGDPYRATAGYNAGGEAVKRWVRQLDDHVEPQLFLPWIGYAETRTYVENVLLDREIYGWILAGRFGSAP